MGVIPTMRGSSTHACTQGNRRGSLIISPQSIAQTRLHLQNIVAGFSKDDEEALVDWKEDFRPHPTKTGEEQNPGRKGKERSSAAGAGDASPFGSKGKGREKSHMSGSANSTTQTRKKRRSGGNGSD